MSPTETPSFHDHPYATFVHSVDRPARYTGGEYGQTRKEWEGTTVKVCLAFPDVYEIGMSHIGTRILYSILNAEEDILCERAFVPWHDMEKQLRDRKLPLVSLENARALRQFDVVGISLQHELIFTNCLTLLDLGGIPLRSALRSETDPLVLGGGSIACHPEPMAPFFDAFVIGDGERKAVEVSRQWARDRRAGLPRQERLRKLAALGGVYVPALYSTRLDPRSQREVIDRPLCAEARVPVVRALVYDIDEFTFPERFPIGGPEAVFERLSVEIARGCMQGCRFCQAGMIYRPQRDRDPAKLVDIIERAVQQGGNDEVSLTSLSTADYPYLTGLMGELSKRLGSKHVALGVSSLRAYGVSDDVLEQLRMVRSTSLTFAPEAGSQRMRDVINKNVSEAQIAEMTERVLQRGWDRLKFYFMLGLPTETMEDLVGIIETTARARGAGRRLRGKGGRMLRVTASVSTFVPKPHTPFQWERMNGFAEVVEKQGFLRDKSREAKVDLKVHDVRASILEGVLSRGDRRLANVIEEAWRAGARFDAWEDSVKWDAWMGAFCASGIEPELYLKELPTDGALPWDHVDVGVRQWFLLRERERAHRALGTPPCGRPQGEGDTGQERLVCVQCGAGCHLDTMVDERRRKLESCGQLDVGREVDAKPSSAPGEPIQYRIRFEKLGKAALLGHLDLVREMPRILRRAGVRLWYSQGFHPKPVMSFGPALSLGVPSFDEYLDVRTALPIDALEVLSRLPDSTPEGLRILEIARLTARSSAIGQVVQAAHYLLALPQSWAASMQAFIQTDQQGACPWADKQVNRKTDAGARVIDMGAGIECIHASEPQDVELLRQAGIAGDWAVVRVGVRILQSGTVRIQEVADMLSGNPDTGHRAVRRRLCGAQGRSPMQQA